WYCIHLSHFRLFAADLVENDCVSRFTGRRAGAAIALSSVGDPPFSTLSPVVPVPRRILAAGCRRCPLPVAADLCASQPIICHGLLDPRPTATRSRRPKPFATARRRSRRRGTDQPRPVP